MPITFDTLDELREFCLSFRLDGMGKSKRALAAAVGTRMKPAKKPGRKPGKAAAVKRSAKAKASASGKKAVLKVRTGETLTSKIQASIRSFLDQGKSFTANDVYDDLAKREKDINKQSVITSVLKQMNTTFSKVKVTERPGNGPRPVKLYNPQK